MLGKLFGRSAEEKAFAEKWNSKYPFLRINDNSIYPWAKNDDCWLSEIPTGWASAFGEQMCDELANVLGRYAEDFVILQMKEKFGELIIYWTFEYKETYTQDEVGEISELHAKIHDIVSKYNCVSAYTCASCGEKANYLSTGWILPYCEKCKPENAIAIRSE